MQVTVEQLPVKTRNANVIRRNRSEWALENEPVERTADKLALNWPYLLAVALVSTAAVAFVIWQITAQVYRPWAHGIRIGSGWNWPIVISWDAVCLFALLTLFWKIYCDAHTEIGEAELCRPSLFGIRRVRWSEIVLVKTVGFGYHICSKREKIVLSPYAYRDPDSVISILKDRIAKAKSEATGGLRS